MKQKKTKPKKLTRAEERWLERLEKLLTNPPSDRIGFYTIGDPCLHAYDNRFEDEINEGMDDGIFGDFGPAVDGVGAYLATVTSKSNIHSTAG